MQNRKLKETQTMMLTLRKESGNKIKAKQTWTLLLYLPF